MHITLMADIEDKLIFGRRKDAVQSDRELDDSKVGTDVAAVFCRRGNDLIANFLGQPRKLRGRQPFDVSRAVNRFEQA